MGRRGGKSAAPYAGLNTSYRVGDDPKVVSQNVCDVNLAVGFHDGRVVTVRQVHDHIVEVEDKKLKEAFFSYRRERSETGRQMSLIGGLP
ncbi:MAG: laccase domain-containing protein [Candidatus Binatia bacterium]